MDYYGLYKGVRNASWALLLRFGVNVLPVSTFGIARRMNVPILTYGQSQSVLEQMDLVEYSRQNDAFALHLKARWFIFLNDSVDKRPDINFTLAHELGHVFLGHELDGRGVFPRQSVPEGVRRPGGAPLERDADMFATRTLSPACVLWGLSMTEPEDIARLCEVPIDIAQARARRLRFLLQRDCFLRSRSERALFYQFAGFIAANSPGGRLPAHCRQRLEEYGVEV